MSKNNQTTLSEVSKNSLEKNAKDGLSRSVVEPQTEAQEDVDMEVDRSFQMIDNLIWKNVTANLMIIDSNGDWKTLNQKRVQLTRTTIQFESSNGIYEKMEYTRCLRQARLEDGSKKVDLLLKPTSRSNKIFLRITYASTPPNCTAGDDNKTSSEIGAETDVEYPEMSKEDKLEAYIQQTKMWKKISTETLPSWYNEEEISQDPEPSECIESLDSYHSRQKHKKVELKRSLRLHKRLENTGNSCYINSVFQALASCPDVVARCTRLSQFMKPNNLDFDAFFMEDDEQLLYRVCRIQHKLGGGFGYIYTNKPIDFEYLVATRRLFGSVNPEFQNNDQQDATEFLLTLLKSFDDVFSKIHSLPKFMNPVGSFTAETEAQNVCGNCHRTSSSSSISTEVFLAMSPEKKSIQDLLKEYCGWTKVEDWKCDHCSHTVCYTSYKFKSFPTFLIVVLKRYEFDAETKETRKTNSELKASFSLDCTSFKSYPSREKIQATSDPSAFVVYQGHHGNAGAKVADVTLPREANREKYVTDENTEGRSERVEPVPSTSEKREKSDAISYKLNSVVCHVGTSPANGHYYCYTRDVHNKNKWLICDDDVVQRVPDHTVAKEMETEGYICIFEKLSCLPFRYSSSKY